MHRVNLAILMLIFGSYLQAYAAVESQSVAMSFDRCLATIRTVASDLGIAPVNIAETTIMRIVRFVTDDGSVLITCSKPDAKMIVTKSD